ncbi:MAG: transposase [Pseudomonadales bacterium]
MATRRKYSAEFKREAVALANQPGVTKAQTGRELNLNPNVITRWQRVLQSNGLQAFRGQGVARDEEMATSKRVNRRRYESHVSARADILDYIKRFHNPRRRQKMELLKLKKANLTQLSAATG